MTRGVLGWATWAGVLLAAIALSSMVEPVDELSSPRSPWSGSVPCPIPLPSFNPLALQRSAIGQTLSIALIDQSNRAFHLGVGRVRRVKAVSRLGRFLEYLDYIAHWRPHFHATPQAVAESTGTDHLVLTAASDKTQMAVYWAYYLDPTNYDAYDLVDSTLDEDLSTSGRNKVKLTLPDGTARTMSTRSAKALLFSYYAMQQYPANTPRGCLARASTLINIWLLNESGSGPDPGRQRFWRTTVQTMGGVAFWLNRSEALRQEEVQAGRWQRQSGLLLADYENHLSLTYAIYQQTLLQYQKWKKTGP